MALSDIVFTNGEPIGFTKTMSRGDIGTVSQITLQTDSSKDLLLSEIPQVTGGSVSEFSYVFVS